jgi:hypothetical protein
MALVAFGIFIAEITKRMNVHDYSSRRAVASWPEQLILDGSDLSQYLRSQFNVEVPDESMDGSTLRIRAGLCQLAGRHGLDASDLLATDATLSIAQRPWFQEFVQTETEKLKSHRAADRLSVEELRQQFVRDLTARDEFQSEFPRFMEDAAQKRGIELQWLFEKADGSVGSCASTEA